MENNQITAFKNETLPAPMARNEREGLAGKMAKDAHHHALRETIKIAVSKCFLSLGKTGTIEDLTFIVNELHSEVLRTWGGIRLEEIGLAIHKLAVGEVVPIDKIYILGLVHFTTAIRAYINSETRIEAVKNNNKLLLLDESVKPSEEEIAKMCKQNALNAFEFFKRNGYYNDYGNSILNYLYGIGLVNFTDDQAYDLLKAARNKVFAYFTSPSRTPDERNEKRRTVEELRANKEHHHFQTEAKKIGLNMLFKSMVEMETELSDLIDPIEEI